MGLVRKLLLRLCCHYPRRLQSSYYRHRFLWWESPLHEHLSVGPKVSFNVPVRGGGCGRVSIGWGSSFGCDSAPKMGSGEILIQARSPESVVLIGEGSAWSNNVSIVANKRITIGKDCRIGDGVSIYDCDFHEIDPRHRNRSPGPTAEVVIGNNVWLGSRVMVLKGVTIGDNSVIAAMSVVTKPIPPNVIAGGNPAKIIRGLD